MKSLHRRLTVLDQAATPYELDYVVMQSGFVYRHARVLEHDEDSLFISQENYPETYILGSQVASARITRL